MKVFKFMAKVGALVAAVVAFLCISNKKEDNKYILVYENDTDN